MEDEMRVVCRHCHRSYKIRLGRNTTGKEVYCPKCGNPETITISKKKLAKWLERLSKIK